MDLAKAARNVIRWLLTVGAALAFAALVYRICSDVWTAETPEDVEVGTVLAAVTISMSLTFGSAFVGWFGLTTTSARHELTGGKARQAAQGMSSVFTTLAGAALFSMFVYLVAGAAAGVTYLANESEAPTVLITVATAWAAQASSVIASTLAAALTPD